MRASALAALCALLVVCACEGAYRPARATYNEGIAALGAGQHEKAEQLLNQAYGDAGVDPELRWSAAYNLGVAYAAHADAKKKDEPEQALELLRQARGWLTTASRLRPDDAATRTNLGIVRARIQAITDELRGEGKLEQRLEALIAQQREAVDGARAAWEQIKRTNTAAPLAQQVPLTKVADAERAVIADAGVAVDVAADEIDVIAKKPEDKRTPEDTLRLTQLRAVDLYLQEARSRLGEARRKLQELAAEAGVGRAEAALAALKRARDQLLDPVTVLRTIAQDELELVGETVSAGGDKSVFAAGSGEETPVWLTPAALAARQRAIRERLDDIKAQFSAAALQPPDPKADKPDPKQAKLLARVGAALPAVTEASTAMERAGDALGASQLAKGLEHEQAAAVALARAVEQFSDLKQTIELAYAEQVRIGQLLGPEAAKQLDAAVRGKETREGLARNLERAARLTGLIADEVTELAAKGEEKDKAKAEQVEQMKQQLARAEELRGQAQAALAALSKALESAKGDPLPHAQEAEAKLLELRKLFFSVIEHLKQLIRDQGETRDRTSEIAGADDFARAPKLPPLLKREDEHGAIAKAIVESLAAQADAAGKQEQAKQPGAPQAPQQGPDAKTLAAAAEEVRQADAQIGDARGTLAKVQAPSAQAQASQSMKPALDAQDKALEHLKRALELLEPPQQNKSDKDKQQQQQQDPKQEQKKQQDQQQQQGAAQRARDDDARRQQQRNQGSGADDVEKDW